VYVSSAKPWFTFLVHPRDIRDLDSIRAASLLRRYSDSEEEYVAKACTLAPLVLGDVRVGGVPVRGEIVCAVRMPDTVMTGAGMAAVVEAAKLAASRGTALIGLGGLTAPAMGGGERLLRHLPAGVKVTNGNGYTAAVTRANVREAAAWLGLHDRAKVVVVGSTGSVGGAASRLLADDGYELVLLGRNQSRVEHLLGDLAGRATLSADFGLVRGADIVVALTHETKAKLSPELVRPGAVVIDVAAPYNIEPARVPTFARRGIHVAKGALARIPGFFCAQDFAMPGPTDTFACLAETYVLARQGLFEHSVGRPTKEYALHVEALAQRYGAFPRPITADLEGCVDVRRAAVDLTDTDVTDAQLSDTALPDPDKEHIVA
jgi:fatty aldehyde-generating acyl-ACP reductase